MKVFNFPWERGPFAKIFKGKPFICAQLTLDHKAGVQAGKKCKQTCYLLLLRAYGAHLNPKKTLHVWWALLSHGMFSNSVALKVTVEANFDIVVEGAIEAFHFCGEKCWHFVQAP